MSDARVAARWPASDGEMAERIRVHDWARTPLGPVESWPQGLRTAVDMVLAMPGPANILWGPAHVQIYNDAYISIAAHRHPAALGRSAAENWPEVYAEVLAPMMEAAFAGRHTRLPELAVTLLDQDGRPEERAFDTTWSPIRDETGGVGGALEVLVEVTERRRAQTALRRSENRYRVLFDAIDAGFCIVEVKFDEEGRAVDHLIVEVNPAFEQQTGLSGAAGRWASQAAPGLEQFWYEFFASVLETGRAVRTERVVEPLGRWYDVHAFPTGEPDRNRVAVLFNDISERRRAEERLRELYDMLEAQVAERTAERDMLATIVEATDVLIMALDLDYNILAINPANVDELERIYGVRPQAGDNMLELLAGQPEQQAQVRAGWARGLDGEHVSFVEDFGDPDRVRPYYDVKFRPLRNEAGELIGAYQFATDITDRLRREAQLAEAQEALRQSQKLESMGQLTGGVAHDFDNLLTPIIGSLDMLQRRGLGNEREQRLVSGAMQSAERAKTLVQRLLAFARRQPLQPVPVDLGRLIEGMADLVASTSGPRVKVQVDVAPDVPAVTADANQLEMAILNLAVNSRDAMSDGGALTIAARPESVAAGHRSGLAPGRYVRLSVSDTGAGMDAETARRAIEPFFSTKGVGKGTGLGLSMVHGLAAQLGGAMTIQSRRGVGTTVKLWLPIARMEVSQPEKAERTVEAAAAGTALLVDDEDLVRASTADMLSDLGYHVVEAPSAEEALRLVDGGLAPDVVVTDHLMPGMTGTDLARALKARRPAPKLLVISGYAEDDGIPPDLPRLTKPFRQAELAMSLAALFERGD